MTRLEMDTVVSQVTVFRDGARVTRTGKIEATRGEHVVVVSGVTAYAQDDSFRVKGRGAAVLRGIDVTKVSRTFEPEGKLRELRQELRQLEKSRDEIADRIKTHQARIGYLQSIVTQFNSEFGKWFAAGESKIDALTSMDKTGVELLRDTTKKLRAAQEELKDVQDKISVVQANIQRVQGERRTETLTEVKVTVNINEDTELELDVTYQLGACGWNPMYDVDISEDSTRLKRIAMLSNSTLEDWVDVSLSVSTASARPVSAVEASPFYVDVFQPMVAASTSTGAARHRLFEMKAKDEAEYEAAAGEEAKEALAEAFAEPTVRVSETLGGTIVYEVPGEITVKSDKEPHPITLTEENFTSKREYYWNAYAMPEVVVQDVITNGESILLPGRVKVYASGDFIGESTISMVAPREKFRLGTRTSYDVKAEKKLVLKDTEKAGLAKGKKRRDYKYRLELKSFSKGVVDIRVFDRIPHSASEKISVQLQMPSLAYKSYEMGILEWETTVEPGKKLDIEYGFGVEWEKDVTITPSLP